MESRGLIGLDLGITPRNLPSRIALRGVSLGSVSLTVSFEFPLGLGLQEAVSARRVWVLGARKSHGVGRNTLHYETTNEGEKEALGRLYREGRGMPSREGD